MNRKYALAASIAAVAALIDQISKFLIAHNLQPNQSIPAINDIFHLTYLTNTGSAFGLFRNLNLLFIFISIGVLVLIIHYLRSTESEDKIEHVFFGLLLGGITGNFIDRVALGHVVDFIDFRVWPVFNLADSFITLSVIGLVFYSWKKK